MNMYYNIILEWTTRLDSFWMADANAISFQSYYLLLINTFFIIWSSLLLHWSSQFVLILFFPSHISLLMADANAIYHSSLIIYYSSTHYYSSTRFFFPWKMLISHISSKSYYLLLINSFSYFIFSHQHISPHLDGWCYVLFHPSFYLVLLSFSLASFQLFHPTHGLFCFILCYLSWTYTFSIMFIPHCKYFFLSSCTRNMVHNAVNT